MSKTSRRWNWKNILSTEVWYYLGHNIHCRTTSVVTHWMPLDHPRTRSLDISSTQCPKFCSKPFKLSGSTRNIEKTVFRPQSLPARALKLCEDHKEAWVLSLKHAMNFEIRRLLMLVDRQKSSVRLFRTNQRWSAKISIETRRPDPIALPVWIDWIVLRLHSKIQFDFQSDSSHESKGSPAVKLRTRSDLSIFF